MCASNATSVWCSLNCQPGHEVYLDGVQEHAQEMMTMECQHKDPSWRYDPWPECVQAEQPDSVEVLHIDLDIEEAFCSNDTEDQSVLLGAIKAQLCGGQENCTIISELPTCEELRASSDDRQEERGAHVDLDGAVYHTVRRRELSRVEGEARKPKRVRPKGKLAIKINVYTRLSKKLGMWSHNVTRSQNLKVVFYYCEISFAYFIGQSLIQRIQHELEHLHENPLLKDKLSELKVDLDRLQVNVNTTCQLGRVLKKNVCGECALVHTGERQ